MDNITIINDYDERISYNIKDLKSIIINGETIYKRKAAVYNIIAIVGPSGCGKTTILNELFDSEKILKGCHFLTFSTSRPKRDNEPDSAYWFYSEKDFEDMINHQDMAQYTIFNNWYYGLEENELSEKYVNIGVFSPKAIWDLMQNYGKKINIKIVYIKASDKVRLTRSLQREENPDVEEIVRRFNTDREDFADIYQDNPIVLINETEKDLIECKNKIESLIYSINKGENI